MSSSDENLDHLAWAIKSRSSNQIYSLRLLTLFSKYDQIWKRKRFARAAQDLTAVAFSLWRAAFLAEKTGKRADVFSHGKSFLQRVIEDNIISYPQDKASREWTFNYYTRNARASLQLLNKYWPEVVPVYEGKKRNATARWEYCQRLLDEAVTGFEKLLHDKKLNEDQAQQAKTVRVERKKRRARVRAITLAERSQVEG
jgi:hypothetical protein